MLGPAFNILLLSQLNPQKEWAKAWITSRVKRSYYPAEILTPLDMVAAGIFEWAKRKTNDPANAVYQLLRIIVLPKEDWNTTQLNQIYENYQKNTGHKLSFDEFKTQVFPKLSKLDQAAIFVNLKPMGLPDSTESKTGLLFRILGFTPQDSIHDLVNEKSHGQSRS